MLSFCASVCTLALLAAAPNAAVDPSPELPARTNAERAAPTAPATRGSMVHDQRGRARPLIVVLHGRGGHAQRFAKRFAALEPAARVVSLEGSRRTPGGSSWLSPWARSVHGAAELAELEDAAAQLVDDLERLQREYPTQGRPIVIGYSQGGMVALAAAALYPDTVDRVVAVSAALPQGIAPRATAGPPPLIELFHGAADEVIAPRLGARTAKRLDGAGFRVRFRKLPGEAHRLSNHQWRRIVHTLGADVQREDRSTLDG